MTAAKFGDPEGEGANEATARVALLVRYDAEGNQTAADLLLSLLDQSLGGTTTDHAAAIAAVLADPPSGPAGKS